MKILSEIQKQIKEIGFTQVENYNYFGYVRETPSAIIISREDGADTAISLTKIFEGIEAVKADKNIYDGGPRMLRKSGIKFIESPLWALLHLVPKSEY